MANIPGPHFPSSRRMTHMSTAVDLLLAPPEELPATPDLQFVFVNRQLVCALSAVIGGSRIGGIGLVCGGGRGAFFCPNPSSAS